MTEDDTFNALRRVPLQTVIQAYDQWWDYATEGWSMKLANKFLEPYGWTFEEMYEANYKKKPPDAWYG